MIEKITRFAVENAVFLYAFLISVWAGLVQYVSRVRMGEIWSWRALLFDIIVCSFSGLLAFFICQEMGIFGWKAALIIAISSHEGTRAVGLLTHFRDRFFIVKK